MPTPTGADGKPPKTYKATAYCCDFGQGKINGTTGVTANGTDLSDCKQKYVIAAGPGSGLTLGDKVTISPNPFGELTIFEVADHGGMIAGRHIDIYIADCATARKWGSRNVKLLKMAADQKPGLAPDTHPGVLGGVGQVVDDATSGLTAVANAIGDIASIVEKFVESLFDSATWFRVGKVVIGVLLGLFGIIILARPLTNSLPPSVKTAAKVAAL